MNSTKIIYSSFPFEWTVKSTSCDIRYRQAFDINEIDEIFCSIIKAKGNEIQLAELGHLLGFNLVDLAEKDILHTYLKGIGEYNLIKINGERIQITEFGTEALQSKLKYKYFNASTEVFENQTALGESLDFSFEKIFNLENRRIHSREHTAETFENPELKQKLQFQLFGNDIYKGEIIDLHESNPNISYRMISLQCETFELDNSTQLSIYNSDVIQTDIQELINLPENEILKTQLLRLGMYHHILSHNEFINVQDIKMYIDLWNWKELAENPKLDWSDKSIFKLFKENGNGGVWSSISAKAPVESIKPVLQVYAEYWDWTILTRRVDDDFLKEHIENFNWDFEELSYRNNELLTALLQNPNLKNGDWDWNYLSKNLPDRFIEKHIDDFHWDFYLITEVKSNILRNLLSKGGKNNSEYANVLLSKSWNWNFISEEFNVQFLYNQISSLAERVDWEIALNRFLNDDEISVKCLKSESFRSILIKYIPENFIVAHQKYYWSPALIAFFDEHNLIQWESHTYIDGFDTNEHVEWDRTTFQNFHSRINTESGFLNVSRQITDHNLLTDFPAFPWNWHGISQNKNLFSNSIFVQNAFTGKFPFSNNLEWHEILSHSNLDVSFWNKNLDAFHNGTDGERHNLFWNLLTKKQNQDYIFSNAHFPWDWSYTTQNTSEEIILESVEDEELIEKWDWSIATRKLSKDIILDNLEDLALYIDWKYLINDVFTIEQELSMDKQLPRIATCLTVLEDDNRGEVWRDLTSKFPFDIVLPTVLDTVHYDVFEWDWEFISNHSHFPTDIKTINKFSNKIDWSIFTQSNAIQKKFNPDSWENNTEWYKNVDRYLQRFIEYWDWQALSQNKNINHNRSLLKKYKGANWDWQYLTEFGGFLTAQKKDRGIPKYLDDVIKQFPKIKFEILSNRKDIKLDSALILSNKDKNWDWQILSANEQAEISYELLLELKDRNWNWQSLSQRKNIEFSNEMLLQLIEKDWDWYNLSGNKNLVFTAEFIEKTKSKLWNWQAVSRHATFYPTVDILTLTKDFDLDWKHLSQHSSLLPTKALLSKFESKWDWQIITENPRINFSDIGLIDRFADKWNWHFICKSGNLRLTVEILNKFKEYLDWNLISANTNIDFTEQIIQEFRQYWNWTALKINKRVEELLGNYVSFEISKNPTLNFIDRIEQQRSEWKGNVYHFSHIDNAVEIIKNRKIQSRNKANIKGDAAGNVVHLRNDAHDFARFYFRPHTPTQFYNEFLGKSINDGYESNGNWVSWYDKARGLGFPKCPIPIFFRFSLKEVLFKHEKECCVSNGNMQTSATKFGSIEEMINKFGFEDLYYTPQQYATKNDYSRYRNYAQQEFLVKNELCFDDLSDFEIVCPSGQDRKLLINLLGSEQKDIFSKIVVDRTYYNNENPRVRIEEEESELHIKSEFDGKGYFVLNGTSNIKELEILAGDVSKLDKDKIFFNSFVSIGNINQNIQLNFIDESGRNWFMYSK